MPWLRRDTNGLQATKLKTCLNRGGSKNTLLRHQARCAFMNTLCAISKIRVQKACRKALSKGYAWRCRCVFASPYLFLASESRSVSVASSLTIPSFVSSIALRESVIPNTHLSSHRQIKPHPSSFNELCDDHRTEGLSQECRKYVIPDRRDKV